MENNSKKQRAILFFMEESWEALTAAGNINECLIFNEALQKQILSYECKLGIFEIYKKYGLDFHTLHNIRYHQALNYFMKTRIEKFSIDRKTVLQMILDEMGVIVPENIKDSLKSLLEKDFEKKTPLLLERMILEHKIWSYHSRNLLKVETANPSLKRFSTFGRFQTQMYEYPFIKFWFLMSNRSSQKEEIKEIWAKLHTAFRKEILELRPEYKERYSDEKAWKMLQKCFNGTLGLVLSGKDVPNNFESEHFPWLLKMIYDYTYKTISASQTFSACTEYAFLYLESIFWGNTITNLFDMTSGSYSCPMACLHYLSNDPLKFQKINSEINDLLVTAIKNGDQSWVDTYDDLMCKVKQQYLFFLDNAYWDVKIQSFDHWKIGRTRCGNGYRLNIGEYFFEDQELFRLDIKNTSVPANKKDFEVFRDNDLALIKKISLILVEKNSIRDNLIQSIKDWYNFYLREPKYDAHRHTIRKRIMSEFMNYVLYDNRERIVDLFDVDYLWNLEDSTSIEKLSDSEITYEDLRADLENCLWKIKYKSSLKLPHTTLAAEQLYELLQQAFEPSLFFTPITKLKPWKKMDGTKTATAILRELEWGFLSQDIQSFLRF